MKSPDGGISVSLPDDSNVYLWNAQIVAPRKSLYEGDYAMYIHDMCIANSLLTSYSLASSIMQKITGVLCSE